MMKLLRILAFVAVLAVCVGNSLQQQTLCEENTMISGAPAPNFAQDGQWFTAACAGQLGNFEFLFAAPHTGGTAQVEARLYTGTNWPANAGSDPGLAVVTSTVNDNDNSVIFDFSSASVVMAIGSQYTVRVTPVSGSTIFIGFASQFPTSPYANGEMLGSSDATSPGSPNVGNDLAFRYFIAGAATPPAVAQGDPHLVGLRGQHYDFIGKENTVFNLLTSPFLQVNSLFTKMEIGPNFYEGTYLQTISIQAHGVLPQPIVVDAGNSSFVDHPSLHFGVGENAVELEARQPNNNTVTTHRKANIVLKTEAVEVTWTATDTTATALGIADNHDDRVVRVATVTIVNVAVIEVFCVENGYGHIHNNRTHPIFATARRNLDVRVRLLNNNMNVHGVIGATNDATIARPPGHDEDYEVKDGLLGTDFIYNLYPHNNNNNN